VYGPDVVGFHDPGNAVPATDLAGLSQIKMNASIAIHPTAGSVRGADQRKEAAILAGSI